MNELVTKYCNARGIDPSEVINKRTDQKTVIRRNAFIYLNWRARKGQISYENPKSKVLSQIGREFGMKRNTIHEKIDQFETELDLYEGNRKVLEEIEGVLSETKNLP